MTAATPKQIALIHVLAKRAGMDEDTRRGFLEREAGARSCTELDVGGADRVIDRLRALTGPASSGAVAGLDNAIGRKLRALWIAAYDLGLARDRTDRAMLSFLERQTGVSHVRFLAAPGAAAPAIEALKRWLARDGGVAWPPQGADLGAVRRAVLAAQWRRLVELGDAFEQLRADVDLEAYAFKTAWRNGWEYFEREHFDRVQNALGKRLRGALARAAARTEGAA